MYVNDSLGAQLLAAVFAEGSVKLGLTSDEYLTIGFGNFELDAGRNVHKFLKQLDTSIPALPGTKDKPSLLKDRLGLFTMEDKPNENLHQEEPHPH